MTLLPWIGLVLSPFSHPAGTQGSAQTPIVERNAPMVVAEFYCDPSAVPSGVVGR